MISKNHPIIVFVDRFGFSVYQDTLTSIPKFNFTPDLVANLDIVDKVKFSDLIATFIQINKIVSSSITIVLSDNAVFAKDIQNSSQKNNPDQVLKSDLGDSSGHEDEMQSFLENVPFENVLAKSIKITSANRVVVANKDLVMTIMDAFTNKGSTIGGVVPAFIYGQNGSFVTGLTLENVKVILDNPETLKLGNLLTDQEKIICPPTLGSGVNNSLADIKSTSSVGEEKKQTNLRQYILVGVFVTLLVILAVVYFNMGVSQTTPLKTKINVSANTIISPTTVPVISQVPIVNSSLDFSGIKIKITQSSLTAERAVTLKKALLDIGIKDVLDEVSETSVPERSSVIFSSNISADLRDSIVAEIKKVLPNISVSEVQDSNFTVSILVGKS